jgi:hypothetical protein
LLFALDPEPAALIKLCRYWLTSPMLGVEDMGAGAVDPLGFVLEI